MSNNRRLLIFLIKYPLRILIAWAVLVIAVYVLLLNGIPLFHNYPLLSYLYICAAFLLYYYPVNSFVKKQYKQINDLLYVQCDPESFISDYSYIIGKLADVKNNAHLDCCRLNLSSGLINAGRYEEAYEVLREHTASKNNRYGRLLNVEYYNNFCFLCLKLGRTDEAENHLDSLIKAMALLNTRDYKKYEKHLKLAQYEVNIANGVFDYAENVYNEAFNKAVNNYDRVNAKFYLGEIYLHFGEAARAKEAFEYVIANGNKLYSVEEAKQKLKLLSE